MVACVLSGSQYAVIHVVGIFASDKIPNFSLVYFCAFMAIVTACYPIGGFIADIYCGRSRIVTISLTIIWTALLVLVIAELLTNLVSQAPKPVTVFTYVLYAVAFLIEICGVSGFYSNIVQFSLDQLQDAPSHSLGILLHWCVWVDLFGETVIHVLFALTNNCKSLVNPKIIGFCLSGVLFAIMSILLVFHIIKKQWFIATNAHYNPYKIVVNVLQYVRTHKYPIRHSALHWTNGERPSRCDFAKNCYGGPFTTCQVEDVKTLGRLVLLLLAIGPVFTVSISTSFFVFPLFSLHVAGQTKECTWQWVLIESGTFSYVVGIVCFPVVMWVVYCVLRNRVPKIITRLEIGIFLSIFGMFSMLVIDLVWHSLRKDTNSSCMFFKTHSNSFPALQLPWYVLLFPSCLNMMSYSIVLVTSLEFISAQSPQAMKGLLFGIFFAIKGCYIFVAAVLLVPFSLPFWEKFAHPSVSCGFGYMFATLLISLAGLFLFACVSRQYKYRVRDEEPFPQAVVEEIYERRIQHNMLDSSVIAPRSGHVDVDDGNQVTGCRNVSLLGRDDYSFISGSVSDAGGPQDRLLIT